MSNIIVFSAPSGTGKTTIVDHLLKKFDRLEFSVSATSRAPRKNEQNGTSYYFLSSDEFQSAIDNGEFIEWEEVYGGTRYGTLISEVDRITKTDKVALFDLDVQGALTLKNKFKNALLIFILPPSLDILRERLNKRLTDSDKSIEQRLDKAKEEIPYATQFDYILLNDDIDEALVEVEYIIEDFLEKKLVPNTFSVV
jgi:guanylate kinase